MVLQQSRQKGALLVTQLCEVAAGDGGGQPRAGREISHFRHALQIIRRLRQQPGRVEGERAERLARAVTGEDGHGRRVVGLQRPHQEQGFAPAREVGLVVPFARARRENLALGKLHLGGERSQGR